jgi:hypothetical protein
MMMMMMMMMMMIHNATLDMVTNACYLIK